jgi:1,2-dihydroxy-3-keto-5-methylthiopentene dioxygenase
MATLRVPAQDKLLLEADSIALFLEDYGIHFQQWPVAGRIGERASAAEVLAAYEPEIAALKNRGGYLTADVIDVGPDTPNLQVMLDRFNKEHTHAEDEVRFVVEGRGLFHIHPQNGLVFAIEVAAGDLINVPAGTRHWFDLCSDRRIRAIRLFKEQAGWTPEYTDSGVALGYEPLCFGPSQVPARTGPQVVPPA